MKGRLGRFEVERGESSLVLRNRYAYGFTVAPWLVVTIAVLVALASRTLPGFALLAVLLFFSVVSFVVSLAYGERRGSYGVLPEVRRSIEIRETSGGYREGAKLTVAIDGKSVDIGRLRSITTRSQQTSRGIALWRLYLVFDSLAYVVETTYERGTIQELQQELERALETRKGSDDGTPAPPDPQRIMLGFVVVGQIVSFAVTIASIVALQGGGWWGACAAPAAILVSTVIFTFAYGTTFRTRNLQRVRDLFGMG